MIPRIMEAVAKLLPRMTGRRCIVWRITGIVILVRGYRPVIIVIHNKISLLQTAIWGFAPKYTGILIVAIVARLRTGHK